MEKIFGVIKEIIFQNEENGYTVCTVESENADITMVGHLPFVAAGESLSAEGEWVYHLEYGEQFKVSAYEKSRPRSKVDIIKYLGSGIIKGIGAITAQRIVDRFGEQALDVLANAPERLAEISGISPKKAAGIGKSYAEQVAVRDVVMFLQKYSISPTHAVRVYKTYGAKAVDLIKDNPYILAEEVSGIGFITADKIASNMGITGASEMRVEAGARHCLLEAAQNGHTYLPKHELIWDTMHLLNVGAADVESAISGMILRGKAVQENIDEDDSEIPTENIYFAPYYYSELGIARRLFTIAQQEFPDAENADELICESEKTQGITLSEGQRSAVKSAVRNGATVITGGPGTGKTTIINMIIKIMQNMDKKVALAAPTGRAAKRMTEICGIEAKTIHRLLEVGKSEGDDQNLRQMFARDEQNPLDTDVLILDELSMIDVLLMNALLKAIKPGTRLIMVGDADQLPSVGAGDVLHNIIESETIPVLHLTEIFRQAKESMIVVNAHRINQGEYPILTSKDADFFFLPRARADEIMCTIVSLCRTRLPESYHLNPIIDIQVLTPMRRSAVGVNTLNEALQNALNPPSHTKLEENHAGRIFREGDKVMQIKNNYCIEWENKEDGQTGLGVFNGDVGYIEKINPEEEQMTVLFDEVKSVEYDYSRLDELELAYAITVHKSQGSEFDVVIMPMFPMAPLLQNRNLLYTGVTRAKKMVILVGQERIAERMTDSVSDKKRYCGLTHKLKAQSEAHSVVLQGGPFA